jgi:hypothetical protein
LIGALLSLIVPGLGQLSRGRFVAGLVWCLAVVASYRFHFGLGMFMHLCCVVGAARRRE